MGQVIAVLIALAALVAAVDILALKIFNKVLPPLNQPALAKLLDALRK